MEVCSLLPGQRYPRKLNETQTAGMIKFTARPPQERAAAIVEGLQTLEYAQGNQYMKEFNMAVSSQMLQVQGRILSPPTLLYGGRDPQIQPRNGGWNMRGKQVIQSAFLRCWMVVCYGSQRDFSQQQIERFIFEFVKQAKATGFNIPMERPPIIYVSPQDDPSVCLQNAADRGRRLLGRVPEMIMCVLPGKGTHPYADIKRASDTVLGIPTQCVQGMHTRSPNPQYVSNVCLKMNMKLGGDNWRLPRPLPVIGEAITIVFGADVSHPPPGDTRRPSIVAVVASVDPFATKYVGCSKY